MTPEETYTLTATLAAQRLLIRELLILSFGRLPDSLNKLDAFAKRVTTAVDEAKLPNLDPALSDAMAQEMADAVRSILEESKTILASLLKQQPPTAG